MWSNFYSTSLKSNSDPLERKREENYYYWLRYFHMGKATKFYNTRHKNRTQKFNQSGNINRMCISLYGKVSRLPNETFIIGTLKSGKLFKPEMDLITLLSRSSSCNKREERGKNNYKVFPPEAISAILCQLFFFIRHSFSRFRHDSSSHFI